MGVSQIEDRTKGLVVVAVWCPFKAQPRGINKTRPNVKDPNPMQAAIKLAVFGISALLRLAWPGPLKRTSFMSSKHLQT